ncbi:cardioacceleratory peptide receptor [Plakobranchus ocellatus]|uniref:Cardioacceleratory peptide receptor n=1 Tax=Plakobranchus ocellatus TaxID=259542 RepID=A0AAV4BU39_9GAST|nr:cardioacceleratory peptide receptor [Plakobranchus ocellatus]
MLPDLLVGVMVSLTDLAQKITIEWYAGNVLCKLIYFTQAVVTYSSTYVLVSLSIDRYDAVARPMNFSRSAQKGRALVIVAWVVSILFALPIPFIYQQHTIEGRQQCWLEFPEYWHWNLYFTSVAVVTFFIPAVIIAGCYIAIIYIIWSKSRTQHSGCGSCIICISCHKSSSTTSTISGSSGSRFFSRSRSTWSATPSGLTISNSRHETGRGIIPQAKIRTIKMTLIIVIVFIVCWSPFFIYNLLELYQVIPHNNPLTTLIQSVAPLNSAANPIIYGIFSTRICRNLRRIPCLRRSVCPCTGHQESHLNNHHHTTNNHNHFYHSYNNQQYPSKTHFRPRQMLTSLATEPTAMTFDLHKVRSNGNGSRCGSVSSNVKNQGPLPQTIPMVAIRKHEADVTHICTTPAESIAADVKSCKGRSREGQAVAVNGTQNRTHSDLNRVQSLTSSVENASALKHLQKHKVQADVQPHVITEVILDTAMTT